MKPHTHTLVSFCSLLGSGEWLGVFRDGPMSHVSYPHTHTCIHHLRTQNAGLKPAENPTTLLCAKFKPWGFRLKQEVNKFSVYCCSAPVHDCDDSVVLLCGQICDSQMYVYKWISSLNQLLFFPVICLAIIPELYFETALTDIFHFCFHTVFLHSLLFPCCSVVKHAWPPHF